MKWACFKKEQEEIGKKMNELQNGKIKTYV